MNIEDIEKDFQSKFWQEFEMNERHRIWDFFLPHIKTTNERRIQTKWKVVRTTPAELERLLNEGWVVEHLVFADTDLYHRVSGDNICILAVLSRSNL